VGVLTQPRFQENNETEYYVASSYVKWLELAGARAIPIPYDAPDKLVDEVFQQINGLLFPGGASDLPGAARRLWKRALRANQRGDFFPIWATCLGYEYVVMLASAKGEEILQSDFDAENISLPLNLVHKEHSRLYANSRIQEIVRSKNVTLNNHFMGVEPSVFLHDEGLTNMFHISSVNRDRKGRLFVSSIEPKLPDRHPVYAVQYHPEKNAFEYATTNNMAYEDINHSVDGIFFSVYIAQFFGGLLQRSVEQQTHVYNSPERHPLVYSYPMKRGLAFEQFFIIPTASHWTDKHVHNAESGWTATEHVHLRGSSFESLQ
jgi:gamma-glutamyl hydrolase